MESDRQWYFVEVVLGRDHWGKAGRLERAGTGKQAPDRQAPDRLSPLAMACC
jgi:hypothetical protein